MSRLLATQRLVALALVEATDGQRTVITPLPVAWSVIRAIVGVLALWWLVRRGVFAALDRIADEVGRLPARLVITGIFAGVLAAEVLRR